MIMSDSCDWKGEDVKARVSPQATIKPCLEASQVASMELRGDAARQQQLESWFKVLVLVVVMLTMVITKWPGGVRVNKLQEGGADL